MLSESRRIGMVTADILGRFLCGLKVRHGSAVH